MIVALVVGLAAILVVLLATAGAVCLVIAAVDGTPGIGVVGVALLAAVCAALYWAVENL